MRCIGGGALCGGVDGLRPRVGRVANLWQEQSVEPNCPCVEPGQSACAQGQRRLPIAPESRPQEGPHQGGKILRLSAMKHPDPLGLKCDTITILRRLVNTFISSNSIESQIIVITIPKWKL
jgi:hypothetical protein